MKRFSWRGLVALGLVAAIALAVPAIASAGSGPGTSVNQRTYRHELQIYKASRGAIEAAFSAAVKQARSLYNKTLTSATTSAERSAALQNDGDRDHRRRRDAQFGAHYPRQPPDQAVEHPRPLSGAPRSPERSVARRSSGL